MKKLLLIVMLAAIAIFVAVPAFACDGQKTASKDCSKTCDAKASCPSHAGCICPGGKAKTAQSNGNDNVTVTSAVAKSDDKTTVNLTGDGGCPMSKGASASKSGKTCTAEEMKACGMDSKSSAKLPNGHPAMTVAQALKCKDAGGSMVAFLSVDKMTCNGCVSAVTKAVGSMEGVCAVEVDLKKASASVVFHPDKIKTDDMISAINKAGYVAAMKTDCSDDMKAVFGENYKEQCLKSCANTCKEKQAAKKTSDS